jgi:hypothetical protein
MTTPSADLTADLAELLIRAHFDGTGCGTNGPNACSNCAGPSPMDAHEIAAVLAARVAVREDKHAALVDDQDATGEEDEIQQRRLAEVRAHIQEFLNDWDYTQDVGDDGPALVVPLLTSFVASELADSMPYSLLAPIVRSEKAGAHAALVARVEALADEYDKSGTDEPHGGELWTSTERSLRALLTDADTTALAVRDAEVRAAVWAEVHEIVSSMGTTRGEMLRLLRDRARAERGGE